MAKIAIVPLSVANKWGHLSARKVFGEEVEEESKALEERFERFNRSNELTAERIAALKEDREEKGYDKYIKKT